MFDVFIEMHFYDTMRHSKPHFHVEYAEHTAVISIDGGGMNSLGVPKSSEAKDEGGRNSHLLFSSRIPNFRYGSMGAPERRRNERRHSE
jgi:hypothetical protein